MNSIKCDYCGKFISYKDLSEGRAVHYMDTPDSELTFETYRSVCSKCNNNNKETN